MIRRDYRFLNTKQHFIIMNPQNSQGFEGFMLTLANNLERDTIYGMVWRVGIGAVLSTIDAGTDLFIITTYYNTESLHMQANAMLAMISANMFVQVSFLAPQCALLSVFISIHV